MSTDEPAPRPDLRGEALPAGRRTAQDAERSYLSLVPWRNFRRVLFLVLALGAVVVLKKSAGGFFHNLLDAVAPPPTAARVPPTPTPTPAPETTVHLQLGSPPR